MLNVDNEQNILTMNARGWIYLRRNSSKSKKIADSKIKTKKALMKADVPVPKLVGLFKSTEEVDNFAWEKIENSFVVKPVSGYGGAGVILVRKRGKYAGEWFLMDGSRVNISDLRYHCYDILQGKYSFHSFPDQVLVEERIKIFGRFLRFTKSGTPDIRVIVFNNIPVMAMMRVPTEESRGRSNLHQGAYGLGIDMATGITTYGVLKDQPITRIYDLKRKKRVKVNGIRIPMWEQILRTAVRAQQAVPGLGYMGVDIVLDKDKGPMVLEINARPGLSIQVANRAGLRERLNRVDGINIRNPEHSINIARSLFGGSFVDKVNKKGEVKFLSLLEVVKIRRADKKKGEILAKIDTGALRSSIDEKLARELGLLEKDNILYYRKYRSSLGKGHRRPVIGLVIWLKEEKIITSANVTDRSHLRSKLLIGRRDLKGFAIRAEFE